MSTLQNDVFILTLALMTCWHRKKADNDPSLKSVHELSSEAIETYIQAESVWVDETSYEDKVMHATFFDKDGLYNKLVALKDVTVSRSVHALVMKWKDSLERGMSTDDFATIKKELQLIEHGEPLVDFVIEKVFKKESKEIRVSSNNIIVYICPLLLKNVII